jgi:peptidoglycan/LPS O-acetylase OafA/YrhL
MFATLNNRNPGLDVLRACCALAVFFFHAGLLAPGWIGVPVFFAISGYVITQSIESHAAATARERILAFYQRRVRRILPPLYLYLLVVLPFVVLAAPEQMTGWLAALTFTYNIYGISEWCRPSYALSHLWSLGIEEQFYLVFPFLLICFSRHATRVLVAVCLIMPLFRLGFAELAAELPGFNRPAELAGLPVHQGAFATYFAGFTQLDAFAVGALLRIHRQRLLRYGSLSAILAMLLVMMGLGYLATGTTEGAHYHIFLATPGAYQYVWGYSLIAVMAGLLIAWFSGLAVRSPVLVALAALGGFSYEFYLVHRPVVRWYQHFLPAGTPLDWLAATLVCFVASTALALLLHYAAGQVTARLAGPGKAARVTA